MDAHPTRRRTEILADTLRRFVRRGARSNISKLLDKTRPEDVAAVMRGLTPAQQLHVFEILVADYPQSVGEMLTEVDPGLRRSLLEELTPDQIATLIKDMAVDDAVSLIESLPQELQEQVVELVDVRRDLDEVQTQLTYQDDTAGRIMVPEFFSLSEENTVSQAIAQIQDSTDLESIFYLYILDGTGHLVGVTSLRQLLLSRPSQRLSDVMTAEIVKVNTETDQEEVAQITARYDLLAIPVTDDSNKMVGIITVDDIIDVVKDEATEDFYKMVGSSDDELLHQERAFRVAGIRLPWLLANFVGLVISGLILFRWEEKIPLVEYFKEHLREAAFLVVFVPVIMGMGGNIGSQASTITVRSLATGRLRFGEGSIRRYMWQQFKVGLVIAFVCALLVGTTAFVLQTNLYLSLAVGLSLFLALVVASVNGAMIPVIFQRLGIDPAVAAGPLVTTSNDISGILIYFGLTFLFFDLLLR